MFTALVLAWVYALAVIGCDIKIYMLPTTFTTLWKDNEKLTWVLFWSKGITTNYLIVEIISKIINLMP